MWANKLATYHCLYASASLLPPLQLNRETGPFPQVEALDLMLLSAGQPKVVRFGDYGPQQHYRPQQLSDNKPLKSIINETKDWHTSDSKTEPDYFDEDNSGTSSDLYQPRASFPSSASYGGPFTSSRTSSSRIIKYEYNISHQTSKHVIRPSLTSINSNQTDSEDLLSSSSHPPKRCLITRDRLRPELVFILAAPRAVIDVNDIEGLKWLLRCAYRVVRRFHETLMYSDEELPPELFQLAFDKLPKNLQYRYREENTTNGIVSNNLQLIKYFLKTLIVTFLKKLRAENISVLCNGRYGSANLSYPTPTFCAYCMNVTDHNVANCPVIRIVQRHVLCFYCLKDGHTIRNCLKMAPKAN